MNTTVNPRELQRLRFRPGQDLLSRDFRDQGRFDDQFRWWHNRAMHEAFGVRGGLTVHAVTTAGEERVDVDGGIAYDAFGREVILPAPATLPIPSGTGEADRRVLVIRYHSERADPAADALSGVWCHGSARPQTELDWVLERRLRPIDGVPLARVLYESGQPRLDGEFFPPAARALARPRMGSGITVAGGTKWEFWNLGVRPGVLLALQVAIDTHAAGFTEVPCYFAWLQGGLETKLTADGPSILLPLYSHVDAVTVTGFRVRVLTFASNKRMGVAASNNALLALARRQLTVSWLGIQMTSAHDAPPEVMHGHS